ncbi:MAG: hypothetical protein JW388_1459 [Nitrospira sp.]|nr:hypothetical protein [Nitrospira sp.]
MDPALWQPWLVGAVVVVAVTLMVRGRAPDLTLLGGLVILVVTGVVSASAAIRGFGNEGLVSVAALYVVAAGIQNTGTISWFASKLLRPELGLRHAITNSTVPVAAASAFLNNTPIVAVLTPTIIDFAKRSRLSPSKLLMPMCFATTLGGTITIIGTSTNLVVLGLVESAMPSYAGLRSIGFFEIAWVGIPLAVVGLIYLISAAPTLIPARVPVIEPLADPRQYTARLAVALGGPLDGRSIADAGLRRLDGLFLVEIERAGESIVAPAPTQKLRGHDYLIFAGAVEQIVQLRGMAGLLSEIESKEAKTPRSRVMVEAVVSNSFPGLGQSIRDFGFRAHYDAAVIAVARNGEKITGRIGDIVLQSGDTLLIETSDRFHSQHGKSRDFFLISGLEAPSLRPHRAGVATAILVAMIVVAGFTGSMLGPALAAAIAMVATGCLRSSDARGAIDVSILIVIGAGLGISQAVESSGLGSILGKFVVELGSGSIIASMVAVYLATVVLTALISNAAAAAIMFPLALGTATQAGVDPMAFVFAVLFAASADFSTPIGYQTNLMIYGPGGYKFGDFVRFGLPLNAIALVVTILGLMWQFQLWSAP